MLRKCRLSGNMLKWIGAVSMTIDHVGVILFPEILFLRILGRLAFPIFAFMIAEGCRYTRNKYRYFFMLFGMGSVCQLVLYLYSGSLEMNVLLTFSVSVLLIFIFTWIKEQIFLEKGLKLYPFCGILLFSGILVGVWILCKFVDLDYGALGCVMPLFAAVLHPPKKSVDTALHRIDYPFVHVLSMGVGVLLLAIDFGFAQYYSLLALPLLLLYSGKRGKRKMKYFFYIFYPAHLLVIQGIAYLFF